jgi:hypothetical protein
MRIPVISDQAELMHTVTKNPTPWVRAEIFRVRMGAFDIIITTREVVPRGDYAEIRYTTETKHATTFPGAIRIANEATK